MKAACAAPLSIEGSELEPFEGLLFGPRLTTVVVGVQELEVKQVVRANISLPVFTCFCSKFVEVEAKTTTEPFELIPGPAVFNVGVVDAQLPQMP